VIKFRHPKAPKPLVYRCDKLLEEGLLLRGTGMKGHNFTALYDLRWADEIYLLRQAGGTLIPCHLRDSNSIHVNRDWAEVVQYMDEVKARRDREAATVIQSEINFGQRMKERVSKANRRVNERRESKPAQSKSSTLRGIRANRKAETERMHEEEAKQLRSRATQDPTMSAPEDRAHSTRTANRYSRVPQITNIAELRKKRMGR
jgi:hypothetical protein